MCGILGLVAPPGRRPNATPADVTQMRDLMTNRGPDDAGLVAENNVIFAHRMLSVIDPGNAPQPMWSSDRRYLLTYNGELYNDDELRSELTAKHGVQFKTRCDTETVLHALAIWDLKGLRKLRGMFALGLYDFDENRLVLARDALGIKPAYFGMINDNFIFASHIPSILAHPKASAIPNLPAMSAYLTTIRTTTGNETMFAGISTLRPGQYAVVQFDQAKRPVIEGAEYWQPTIQMQNDLPLDDAAEQVREAVVDSVGRHLRSDVSRCVLLSGGIDSTIIAAVARQLGATDALKTWCAGDPEDSGGDREFARLAADCLGTHHHDIIIDQPTFHRNWDQLVEETGLPLSTPNETAIYEVARSLKSEATVALSGEGADEMFAGYALPLLSGLDQMRTSLDCANWPGGESARERFRTELSEQYGSNDLGTPLDHYFRCHSWIHPELKASILRSSLLSAIEGDQLLIGETTEQFNRSISAFEPAEQLLQIQRRINLTGLLQRLDTATMAGQVEGRTPFADVEIAELAMGLPISSKIQVALAEDGGWSSAAVAVAERKVTTKAVLRRAFADCVPPVIVNRAKASFPLPFQSWLGETSDSIRSSAFLREVFDATFLAELAADPSARWQTAWPIANLARWSKRWWG